MNVKLNEKTWIKLYNTAQILHVNENDLAERALQYFLFSMDKELQLKQDFNNWDDLSDEALLNFENSLI